MKNSLLFKTAMTCIIIAFSFYTLIIAKDLLVPIIISALLAMVLLPLCQLLEKVIPRFLAILICIFTLISLVTGILLLFYYNVIFLLEDIPLFKVEFIKKIQSLSEFIEDKTGISYADQKNYIKSFDENWLQSAGGYVQNILLGLTGGLAIFALIIIYIFFFLLYRQRIKIFILKLFPEKSHTRVGIVINHTQDMSQNYLTGLLIELTILGSLNAFGLVILGIKHAVFFGFLAGLLNIIPYVGVLIGSLFPIFMAFIFKDSWSSIFAVIAVMSFNQFIDNNILTPKIIGSQIQLNALATIIVIILGGMVWGIPGMILFIPLLGIFKIVCDFVVFLHPVSYLLSEDIDEDAIPFWDKLKSFFKSKSKV